MRRNRPITAPPLELWGGIECSQVLIHGELRDQMTETGHRARDEDLDRVAELGIRTIRYPLLWADAETPGGIDFGFHDARFARIAHLGMSPVAGLVHHGSGPDGVTPTDGGFVRRLAAFAGLAAARYPQIELWTPINEPVTSARFAYLYGHWHPHLREEAVFLRAVAASMLATAEAMREIRRVTPAARLVQTEDFGRVFATRKLAGQAAYENERRFLGLDLLCGRVDRTHFFHAALLRAGVPARVLDRLRAEPCPPNIIGIDHYLTSDRYLDQRLRRHPGERAGGNGTETYVDIAAAHVPWLQARLGAVSRIRELHARYRIPIALSETHNGCTRDEQLRWLSDAWLGALQARAEGVSVRAVTMWGLFGFVDWNSLMLARAGHYEPGAFDSRSDPPRPTALAQAARSLAATGAFDHPLLARPGWWRNEIENPGPMLHLAGPLSKLDVIAQTCERRRITVTFDEADRASWGSLAVAIANGALQFAFRRRGGGKELLIECEPAADFTSVADAVLDLAIDELRGRFVLREVGPHGRYRLEPNQEYQWRTGSRRHLDR